MKHLTVLIFAALACVWSPAARAEEKPTVEAAVAVDDKTPPADTFAGDVPKLYAFFKTKGTKSGDKVRGVWVAEDVGAAAPKETKIDEATVALDKEDGTGAVSLSKPTKGWPLGKYRVDFYLGETLATSTKITIRGADADKPADDGAKEKKE